MTTHLQLAPLRRSIAFLAIGLLMSMSVLAQLPTASTVASQMTIGWNIGNSLECPGSETAWGNPAVTQTLINAVKAAGFNSVRIPCAWDSHANATTYVIDAAWLARVKQVVDYCITNNMYAIINIHYDGGWLEDHPLYSYQVAVNAKQKSYWTQIANYFKTYNEHLLFAGTNEVHADYGTPTAEHIAVQQSYNQTFVDAVRATGGNNASRTLVVQTYNTNIWHGLNYFTLPTDAAVSRLIVEVHNYDPYDYTLNTSGSCLYWGAAFPVQSACTWAQESYFDDLFARVKAKWVNNGVPVIIGEYGVIKRTSLTGQQLIDHIAARQYYLKYVTAAALLNGIKSFYWDNGFNGNNGLALFDRNSGAIVDQGALTAIMQGAGIGNPSVNYTLTTTVNGSGTVSRNPSGTTYPSGTSVTLTATPATGYSFTGWSGDLTGTTNPATITMNANKAVTATFTQITGTQYTLTVNVTGQGTVSPNGGSYASGTSVSLTATPATGYHFTSWSGAATGSTNPVAVVMNANKTITALFEVNTTTGCANPVTISIPFVQNGAGNFCWVTSTAMAYVNSWNMTSLKINGVDYTNKWSNSLPAAQNGQWFIEYSASVAWAHFEAPSAVKSAKATIGEPIAGDNNGVHLYPNPFKAEINLIIGNPDQVDRIVILDQLGRQVETIGHGVVKNFQAIGSSLKAGMYIVQVYGASGLQTFKVTKN